MTITPSLFDSTDTAWTVTQVARAVKHAVDGSTGALWVRGEVSGLKSYQSGHWYFTLRDADSQLRCVMWRTYAQKVRTPPADGTQVFVFASPTVWEERGELRLNVTELLPTDALGAEALALERIRKALEKDGLFDAARKRALPPLATRIAVVTSLDGAALRDIITVARKRWPSIELVVVGSTVQGEGAEADLVRAFGIVNRLAGIDLCIVGRGGGSREDLAVFNSEAVCRALARVRVPTISAVGHETDVSFSDLVADVRAPTPSAAAELAIADRRELAAVVTALAARLAGALMQRSRLAAERLARTADRLQGGIERLLESRRRQVERLGVQLDALSPLRVLERGYSVARSEDGRVLKRRADFPASRPFTLRVADGTVPARVEPA